MIIGFVSGVFDLLHTGHIILLQQASNECDYLIVALQTDPTVERESKSKPIQSVYERFTQLKSIKYVNEIIPYTTEAELTTILETNDINVRIVSSEYVDTYTGKYLVEAGKMKVVFLNRIGNYSSSELKQRIKND